MPDPRRQIPNCAVCSYSTAATAGMARPSGKGAIDPQRSCWPLWLHCSDSTLASQVGSGRVPAPPATKTRSAKVAIRASDRGVLQLVGRPHMHAPASSIVKVSTTPVLTCKAPPKKSDGPNEAKATWPRQGCGGMRQFGSTCQRSPLKTSMVRKACTPTPPASPSKHVSAPGGGWPSGRTPPAAKILPSCTAAPSCMRGVVSHMPRSRTRHAVPSNTSTLRLRAISLLLLGPPPIAYKQSASGRQAGTTFGGQAYTTTAK
mmetsp:Transcript_58838/g.179438  ORF Transcript_58838/g.179438 Transcript_58838/m.179438 type:complete len:260 (-) Transcript_58838:524-1303(-)